MEILFFVILIAATAYRVFRLKKKQASPPADIKEFNIGNLNNIKSILSDTSKWNKYASTYDEEIVKKRRGKFIANFNEMLTRQALQEYALLEWTKFSNKIQNISANPAKVFRNIFIPLLIGFATLSASSQSAKDFIEDGNQAYKNKNYSQALSYYNSALGLTLKPQKLASVHYKIAITYNKLKNCDSAKVHYGFALENDPQNGGAGDIDKFNKKLHECHLNKEDLGVNNPIENNTTESQAIPQPDPNNEAVKTQQFQSKSDISGVLLFIFLGIPFILLASWIIAKIIGAFAFNVSSKQKRMELDAFVHDDLFWNGLAGKGFKTEKIEEVKKVFTKASNSLSTSSSDIIVSNTHRHIYWLKNNPAFYLADNALQAGYLRYLIKASEIDFYCFFTSEHLPEGKSTVFIIKHPNNSALDRKVWVSGRVQRMIEKNAKIKARLHEVNGAYTHWSNDQTYYDKFTSQIPLTVSAGNMQTMQNWKGEAREIDLNKYYEIFTSDFPNYIFPNDDAIVQGYIDYQGEVPIEKTGFDNQGGNYQQGDNYTSSSGLDPLLTGTIIGSMLSDHDRNRYDNDGNRTNLSDVS